MRRSYLSGLPLLGLLACSAPEDAKDAIRCTAQLLCPEELVCYRGYCVDDGLATEFPTAEGDDAVELAPGAEVDGAAPIPPNDQAPSSSGQPGSTPGVAGGADAAAGTGASSGNVGSPSGSTPDAGSAIAPGGPGSTVPADPSGGAADAGAPAPSSTDAGSAPMTTPPTTPPTTTPPTTTPPTTTPPTTTPPTTTPPPAAGETCVDVCKGEDQKRCDKCFEDVYGSTPKKLCGGSGDDDDDDSAPIITLNLNPICLTLCIGDAKKSGLCTISLLSERENGNAKGKP